MNNRLKQLREIINLSQNEFAEQIGIARSTLSLLEKGERILQDRHIKLICQTFNVNEEWLRNGIEPIFKEKENDALKEIFKQYGLSEFMQDIAIRYLNLDEKEQEAFEIFIKGMMKEIPEKNKPKGQYGMNYKTLIEEENKELEKNKRKVL